MNSRMQHDVTGCNRCYDSISGVMISDGAQGSPNLYDCDDIAEGDFKRMQPI